MKAKESDKNSKTSTSACDASRRPPKDVPSPTTDSNVSISGSGCYKAYQGIKMFQLQLNILQYKKEDDMVWLP